MQEGSDLRYIKYKLGFLYEEIHMNKGCLDAWMNDAEFLSQIWNLVKSGTIVGDTEVLSVAKALLEKRLSNKDKYQGFRFQSARRGLHQLERHLSQQ